MGEQVLEALLAENKMGEESVALAHVPRLEQSVSFGRFEHDDSLCWERWSTFPSNKYLEEVEKCSTPGSVAEKKAYFEAHYKKITAQKLQLMDQGRMRETESFNSEEPSQALIENDGNSVTQKLVCGVEVENEVGELNVEEVKDVHVDIINGEEQQHDVVNFNGQENELGLVSQPENGIEGLCHEKESSEFGQSEEPTLAKEEDALVSENKEELPHDEAEERKMVKKATQDVNLKNLSKTQKVAPTKKIATVTNAIRKPVPQMTKRSSEPKPRSQISSTLKSSKPGLSKTQMSTTRTPVKKNENRLTPMTTKKASSRPEIKRVLPTSPHMSLSLGPSNSDPAALIGTARKSLITERMGDKDIVRKVFKSFQSTAQRSSTSNLVKAPLTTQSPIRKIEQKGSATRIVGKKSEGIIRAEKASTQETSQQTTRKTSGSPGLRKNTAVMDQRNSKPDLISLSSRSQDRGNKQKEVSKILDRKSDAKQAGNGMTQLQVNVKVERRANNIKKPGQSKLSSSYNEGHGFKRLHKGDAMTASVGA